MTYHRFSTVRHDHEAAPIIATMTPEHRAVYDECRALLEKVTDDWKAERARANRMFFTIPDGMTQEEFEAKLGEWTKSIITTTRQRMSGKPLLINMPVEPNGPFTIDFPVEARTRQQAIAAAVAELKALIPVKTHLGIPPDGHVVRTSARKGRAINDGYVWGVRLVWERDA